MCPRSMHTVVCTWCVCLSEMCVHARSCVSLGTSTSTEDLCTRVIVHTLRLACVVPVGNGEHVFAWTQVNSASLHAEASM